MPDTMKALQLRHARLENELHAICEHLVDLDERGWTPPEDRDVKDKLIMKRLSLYGRLAAVERMIRAAR